MDRTVLMEQQAQKALQEKQESMVRMESLAPQARPEPMGRTVLMEQQAHKAQQEKQE